MSQEILDLAQVSPLVGECEPGRVPEHMSVNQRQPGFRADPLEHPLEPRDRNRPALAREDELTAGWLLALELAQLSQLVTEDWVRRAGRAFGAMYGQPSGCEIDL